jgi:hypothetical protein
LKETRFLYKAPHPEIDRKKVRRKFCECGPWLAFPLDGFEGFFLTQVMPYSADSDLTLQTARVLIFVSIFGRN